MELYRFSSKRPQRLWNDSNKTSTMLYAHGDRSPENLLSIAFTHGREIWFSQKPLTVELKSLAEFGVVLLRTFSLSFASRKINIAVESNLCKSSLSIWRFVCVARETWVCDILPWRSHFRTSLNHNALNEYEKGKWMNESLFWWNESLSHRF